MFKMFRFARLLGVLVSIIVVLDAVLPTIQETVAQGDEYAITQLTDGDVVDRYPAWNPAGTLIAFNRTTDTDNDGKITVYLDMSQIFVMNADGSNQVVLTSSPLGTFAGPQWSPDGQYVAYKEFEERGEDGIQYVHLCIVQPDGTNQRCFLDESVKTPGAWPGVPIALRLPLFTKREIARVFIFFI